MSFLFFSSSFSQKTKLEVQNIKIIFVARWCPDGGVWAVMMMTLKVEKILSFEAVVVARFFTSKLHEILLQRWRLTAAATRLVRCSVADVVVVVTSNEWRRWRSVLFIDELKLFVHVQQLLTTETTLAYRVKLYLTQWRGCWLFRL